MKRFNPLGGVFLQVTYLDSRTLLAVEFSSNGTRAGLWSLDEEREPIELSVRQLKAAWYLFQPGATEFLKREGYWPDNEALPPPYSEDPQAPHPILERGSLWSPCAFTVDGRFVLFRETVITQGFYSTRFHLRMPNKVTTSLYHARTCLGPCAAFSPSGNLVAMSGGEKTVCVWDRQANREASRFEQRDGTKALAFVSESRLLASAGRTIRLWDASTGQQVKKFPSFRKHLNALAVSSDRSLFMIGGRNGIVRIWESESGQERGTYDWEIGEVRALSFSPDGSTAVAAGTRLVVWDLD